MKRTLNFPESCVFQNTLEERPGVLEGDKEHVVQRQGVAAGQSVTYFGHPSHGDIQRPQDVHAQLLECSFFLGFLGRNISGCLHNSGVVAGYSQFSGASQEAQVWPHCCFCASL